MHQTSFLFVVSFFTVSIHDTRHWHWWLISTFATESICTLISTNLVVIRTGAGEFAVSLSIFITLAIYSSKCHAKDRQSQVWQTNQISLPPHGMNLIITGSDLVMNVVNCRTSKSCHPLRN
jgi:hypothetical protein